MNAPSKDVADYLAAQGLGTFATDIFTVLQPDSPAKVLTVYDTGGFPRNIATGLHRPTVQIRTRANTYAEAYAFALSASELVAGLSNVSQGGAVYVLAKPMSEILSLGVDAKGRHQVSVNIELMRTTTL
jgi:hypothetical protein